MKNSFKKALLLCVALATSISSFTISTGGAVAAGLGTAAAVGLIGWGIHKSHKHHKEQKDGKKTYNKTTNVKHDKHKKVVKNVKNKKDIKHQIRTHAKTKMRHQKSFKKLQKQGKGASQEAVKHKNEIARLERLIKELKMTLKNL
jgi:uncharacterized protein HemX